MKAPAGKELEGPINEVLQRCMDWVIDGVPSGPQGRKLEDAQITGDQRARRVEFEWPDGKRARADAQVIGFLIQETGQPPGVSLWRWGWDDPGFDKAMVKHGLELKKYGEKRKIEEFSLTGAVRVHRDRCWAFTGLAAALNGAAGAVGCPVEDKLVMLTIGPVKS